jgi:uncharacterized membrane protein
MEPNAALDALSSQVSSLQARVRRLEEAVRRVGIAVDDETSVAPEALQPPPPQVQTLHLKVARAPSLRQPAAPVLASVEESNKPDRSLENRIGSHLFNRIGVVALLIGAAWALKLAIDNHWIGALGRVTIGLLAGIGAIVWSERFRRKNYLAFSYSLKAVGSGLLYLSLWAASSYFHLMPVGVAFAAMVAVTAFNGYMAWLQDAELLAVYCIVGGFSTPALLSTGGNHEVFLLSYLLLLDAAVLALVVLKPWSRLLSGAFAGTIIFFAGWAMEFYSNAQFGRTAAFLTVLFLLFAFAPRLMRVRDGEHNRWDALSFLLLPVVNAGLAFLGWYGMLSSARESGAAPWVAVAFAAFFVAMLRLPGRGVLRGESSPQAAIHLAAAVIFLAVAIPLQTHGRWLTIGWLVQGAALLWVSHRAALPLLRKLGLLCLIIGLGALVLIDPHASLTPLLNQRFATYCVAIAVFAALAWWARGLPADHDHEELPALQWTNIAAASALLVNGLILLAVSREIHNYWWSLRWRGNESMMRDYRMYAQFSYSAFFMLFGSVLLVLGFARKSAFVRWQALVLVAVTIGKVFLVDISQLSQGYRILSFLGLGVLLLAVSFVYQRDWLHLRDGDGSAT